MRQLSARPELVDSLRATHAAHIQAVTCSLALEGSKLTEAQVAALHAGEQVSAPVGDILATRNALAAYGRLPHWVERHEGDLMTAHRLMMTGLARNAGRYRGFDVTHFEVTRVADSVPLPGQVPRLMKELFAWLGSTHHHPLITSSVFHYQLVSTRPFDGGNERLGRLWQTALLARYSELFHWLPLESVVYRHRLDYLRTLKASTETADALPFVGFMLSCIDEALREVPNLAAAPVASKGSPPVLEPTPEVSQAPTPVVGVSSSADATPHLVRGSDVAASALADAEHAAPKAPTEPKPPVVGLANVSEAKVSTQGEARGEAPRAPRQPPSASEGWTPPFSFTQDLALKLEGLTARVTQLEHQPANADATRLWYEMYVRALAGTLNLAGNPLPHTELDRLLSGDTFRAPKKQLLEARNATLAHGSLDGWEGGRELDLLSAHGVLMAKLAEAPGRYRTSPFNVLRGEEVAYAAPPADEVPHLMGQLFTWLRRCEYHPLIASSLFHYEVLRILPFNDGNGRIARLWQRLLLVRWREPFSWLPVDGVIHQRRGDYFGSLQASIQASDAAPFVRFMVSCVADALHEVQVVARPVPLKVRRKPTTRVPVLTQASRPSGPSRPTSWRPPPKPSRPSKAARRDPKEIRPTTVRLTALLRQGAKTRAELGMLLREDGADPSFYMRYIYPALSQGYIKASGRHGQHNKEYRLTEQGQALAAANDGQEER
ncbi:MAG: Fic family protein [Polyangiaceae bacterium]|nr:Fic family protein [Polyangiaceae bacterium]MCW5791992.1 Fic family protein [Polyangiaceae bacterium]